MPTPAEHRALLFVAAVAALGIGVRGFGALREPAVPVSDRESLARQIASVDSILTLGGRRRSPSAATAETASRPARQTPGPRESATRRLSSAAVVAPSADAPVDVDRATVELLDRLPGIGPTLATRIVADREANGPFGSLDGLERVKGIGPALLKRLQPHVTFSLPPRPSDAERSARQGVRRP